MKQYIEVTSHLGRDFSVLSGNDSLILPNLVFGGRGGIACCANVFPKTLVRIYESFMAGDFELAQKTQDNIRILRASFKYGNPNTIVKYATSLLGYPVGPCRRPFNGLTEEGKLAVEAAVQQCREAGLE